MKGYQTISKYLKTNYTTITIILYIKLILKGSSDKKL